MNKKISTTKTDYLNISNDSTNQLSDFTDCTLRWPVVLLIASSSAMMCDPVIELNKAFYQFLDICKGDYDHCMDLEIISLAGIRSVVQPFVLMRNIQWNTSKGTAGISAPLEIAPALASARQDIHVRKQQYRESGLSSYRPLIVLMANGIPEDQLKITDEKMWKLGKLDDFAFFCFETCPDIFRPHVYPSNVSDISDESLLCKIKDWADLKDI